MPDRSPRQPNPRTAMTTIGGQLILSERLAMFKRVYRWLNLTLIHQAIWPLLLLLTSAPVGDPERTPFPWYLARVAAPAAAALLALVYLRQRPLTLVGERPERLSEPATERSRILTTQARFLLLGLPVMLLAVRLVDGPAEPAAKLALFGLADVAAYHVIHWGVVVRSYPARAQGIGVATLLFALSWAIRDALLTALGPSAASPVFAAAGGFAVGLVMALLARAIQRWPGGYLTAAAAHWLLIYLVLGFAG